jgi:hypothetical protein
VEVFLDEDDEDAEGDAGGANGGKLSLPVDSWRSGVEASDAVFLSVDVKHCRTWC